MNDEMCDSRSKKNDKDEERNYKIDIKYGLCCFVQTGGRLVS